MQEKFKLWKTCGEEDQWQADAGTGLGKTGTGRRSGWYQVDGFDHSGRRPVSTLRVRKEIKVADRAEILSILQGAKSEHIEYM
jgi:hypothetical protein